MECKGLINVRVRDRFAGISLILPRPCSRWIRESHENNNESAPRNTGRGTSVSGLSDFSFRGRRSITDARIKAGRARKKIKRVDFPRTKPRIVKMYRVSALERPRMSLGGFKAG